jgi:putative ABC transport system substrate-binding protein
VSKWLSLAGDLVPQATTVGFLSGDSSYLAYEDRKSQILAAARALGRQVIILETRSDLDYEAAFKTLVQREAGALIVGPSPLRNTNEILGRHFKMEDRNAEGRIERLPALAGELARLPVDFFVVFGDAPIAAAMQASDRIPIIMTLAADPVGSGFVDSLAHPGGNVTGMSALAPDLAGKRVELLKELVPRASRVAVLWNSSNRGKITEWNESQDPARSLGLTLHSFEARSQEEVEGALAAIRKNLPDALIVLSESLTIAFRQRIGSFALANRLPMVSELRELTDAGGLASYGVSRADLWRRSASYVAKIVRGARPGDLPVEQPTKFEMLINLNTAKAIGLDVPAALLARADEVIE